MNKTTILATAAIIFFSTITLARAEVLLDENFDKYAPAATPSAATIVAPKRPVDGLSVTVVSAAGGKAVRILDNDATKGTSLEYNLASTPAGLKTAVKVSFDLVRQAEGPDKSALIFGVGDLGEAKTELSSGAKRHIAVSFYADGRMRVVSGALAKSKTLSLGAVGARNQIALYLNEGASPVKTTGPDGKPLTIQPASVVACLDGKQIYNGKVDKFGGAEKQIGRVGFITNSNVTGIDFTVDNLKAESL